MAVAAVAIVVVTVRQGFHRCRGSDCSCRIDSLTVVVVTAVLVASSVVIAITD